nr:hypothetical protein [Tanacetum cinerariifolium]
MVPVVFSDFTYGSYVCEITGNLSVGKLLFHFGPDMDHFVPLWSLTRTKVEQKFPHREAVCNFAKVETIHEKRVLTGIKQLDDLEERIENVEQILFRLRDIKMKRKDLQWKSPKHTQEAEQKPLDVPIKSQEEDPLPLDIDFPYPEIASSSTCNNPVVGLRAPKAEDGCCDSERKKRF